MVFFSAGCSKTAHKVAQSNFSAAKGQVKLDTGKWQEAEEPLKKAIEIRPEHGIAHYNLARVYIITDRPQDAVQLMSSYIDHMAVTREWVGPRDRKHLEKIKDLLEETKRRFKKELQTMNSIQ